jgi:hypothetical protein
MRTRKHYLPIAQATAGMVLAEPVQDAYQRTYLPAQLALTDEHLHQLEVWHAEFICIAVPDERTDEQVANDSTATTRRVLELFEQTDPHDPLMAALLNQILLYRSS